MICYLWPRYLFTWSHCSIANQSCPPFVSHCCRSPLSPAHSRYDIKTWTQVFTIESLFRHRTVHTVAVWIQETDQLCFMLRDVSEEAASYLYYNLSLLSQPTRQRVESFISVYQRAATQPLSVETPSVATKALQNDWKLISKTTSPCFPRFSGLDCKIYRGRG